MNHERHPLHKDVGRAMSEWMSALPDPRVELFLSNDCGGSGALKVRRSMGDYPGVEMVNADLLVVRDGEVRLQIEIEERDTSPTKLYGKVLASSMCDGFHPNRLENGIPFASHTAFIQIVRRNEPEGPRQPKKPRQWKEVKETIVGELLPFLASTSRKSPRVMKYDMLENVGASLQTDKKAMMIAAVERAVE